ncbi:DUF2071 domain-containing protein [Salinibacter altiplanensis]|uniref:DUF2071 domain-containing protein n=1 Tax=Salinibacter altiplanensis TaxID=1803181 RepID=UPI000C9F5E2A|nr:DUF2071 domain-containing protein [Salinibacter altiplanensis]
MSISSLAPRCVLQATAQNRVVLGYAVDPDRVAPLLPDGLVPARHEGTTYVSLVGVELADVRGLGLAVPGVQRVPAVELRIHVRPAEASSGLVGTWTAQAHVSRRLVAWGARRLYGETIAVTSMQPIRREHADHVEVTYRFDWRGREQRIRVRGERAPVPPPPDARAHILLSPDWRFGTARDGTLLRARIKRPATPVHRVQEHHVTVQWPAVYGDLGQLLANRSPTLVLLSSSAPVTLHWRTRGQG